MFRKYIVPIIFLVLWSLYFATDYVCDSYRERGYLGELYGPVSSFREIFFYAAVLHTFVTVVIFYRWFAEE